MCDNQNAVALQRSPHSAENSSVLVFPLTFKGLARHQSVDIPLCRRDAAMTGVIRLAAHLK